MSEQQNKQRAVGVNTKRSTQTAGAQSARRQTGAAKATRSPSFYAPRPRQKPQAPPPLPPVKIYPLGGLGEIGKNLTVYECTGDMIIVDCGSSFPESDMFGIDLVIPDFAFLQQNQNKILGILVTHGHEDHIGALPYLLREMNLPIFATRLTLGLVSNKLEEHGLRASTELRQITSREKFTLGCFVIDPIAVNHSIPDAVAFAIECPAGTIIHTGDWKIDYTPVGGKVFDLTAFSEYGQRGVLALMSDSTNSERAGSSASESTVNAGLTALFEKAGKRRVIVATFASNLYRVQLLIDLAVQTGRKVAISGRSMIKNTEMAMELGYLHAPSDVLIDIDRAERMPPEHVTIITTGSQGETLSALSRMASGSHRQIHVGAEDFIIISATPIPGNEKMVTKVINGLLRLGAEVIYENMYDVHASGHACQEEQKLIMTLTKPKYFVPLHGEFKHLKRHAATALMMGVPAENILIADTGDGILINEKGISISESVQAGAVMVDGLGVGDVGSVVLRDRRLLSQDGIMIVAATVSKKSGKLQSGPEVFTRGFVYVKDSEELLDETRELVAKALTEYESQQFRDIGGLKTLVREIVSSLLYSRTKRSPMILPIIMED